MFEEGVDYELQEIEGVDVMPVKFLKGKFKDVVYCYGQANVKEQGEGATLSFDFILIDPGEYTREELTNSEDFHTMIGDLLVQMIIVKDKNEPTRTDDTQEPDLY